MALRVTVMSMGIASLTQGLAFGEGNGNVALRVTVMSMGIASLTQGLEFEERKDSPGLRVSIWFGELQFCPEG